MDELFSAVLLCMAKVFEENTDEAMFTLFWGNKEIGQFAISVRRPNPQEKVDHFGAAPQGYKLH